MTESAQGPLGERAEVSVELHLLRLPNRRIDLIIRRGVAMRDGSGEVAATEELWTVAVQGGTLAAAAVIREELSRVGSALLHGRPPVGLDAPTERDLQRLREDLQGGDVEFVAAVGVTVQDFFARNAVIVDADVVAGRGMAAGAARRAFLALLTGLGRLPAGEDDAAAEPPDRTTSRQAVATDVDAALQRRAVPEALPWEADELLLEEREDLGRLWSSGLLTDDRVELAEPERPERVVIEFVCVEVGQIGDGNLRVVIHNYRLEPTLDLEDLLARPGVRDALQACATAPDDERLRRAAVAELLRAPADGTDFAPPETTTPEFSGGRSDYEWEAEFGLVILHDCRGIQVGDHNRQYATFAHVVAPDVDVAGLVRSNPSLAHAVVDTVCGLEAAGDLQNRLVEAVVAGAESAYGEGPPGGGLHPWQSLTAVGERNISVGDGNVEQSHVLIDWDGADPLVEPFVGLHARLAREAEEAAKAADVEATVDWVDRLPTPGPDDLRAYRPNIDYEADTRTSRPEAEPHFDTSYETRSIRPDTRWSGPPGPGL